MLLQKRQLQKKNSVSSFDHWFSGGYVNFRGRTVIQYLLLIHGSVAEYCLFFVSSHVCIHITPPKHEFYFLWEGKKEGSTSIHLILLIAAFTLGFFPPRRMRIPGHHQDDMGIPNLHFPRLHREGPGPHPTSQHLKEPSKKTRTR